MIQSFSLLIEEDEELRYKDTRKFGRMYLLKKDELNKFLASKLGYEPWDKNLTIAYLKENLKNKTLPIKTLLLDQKLIAGIGNIYADEILFLSKINPHRKGKSLNDEELEKIIENTKNVIINLDFNKIEKQNKFISYGYNSKSDITISSIDEDEALIYIQKEITSIFGRKIEPQEVKVKLKSDINIYNIMIIIALNVLYTR